MKLTAKSAAVGAFALLVPSVVFGATTVTGKVINTQDLLNPVWNEAKSKDSHRYTFREPASSVPPEARILRGDLKKELCVVALTDGTGTPNPKPVRIVIEGGRTSAVTLVVAPGQLIHFENKDPTDHAIYEVTEKGGLGRGTMKPEQSRDWTPPGPGKYELRDELSPSLRSWIVVEPRTVQAVFPTRKGDLLFKLEPGNYKLRAYYNGEPVGEELPIEVQEQKPTPGPKPTTPEQQLKDPLKAGPDKKPAEGDKDKDKDKEKKDEKDPKAPLDPKKIAPPIKGQPPKGGG